MIPIHFLSKIGIYNVQMEDGVKVQAKLINNISLLNQNIYELRSLLKASVVGLDVKLQPSNWPWMRNKAQMLILCVENRCLIIQLDHFDVFPESLKIFLADEKICFVGKDLSHKLSSLGNTYKDVACKTGVEVGDLAARVLKKPYISTCGLLYLAIEAGVHPIAAVATLSALGRDSSLVDWSACAFTDEEIKYAIREAYACYLIGNKLLGTL